MAPLTALIDTESDRRDLILSAAERAFARHGFHGANMQNVAAEAQMSAGNLYRYFKSKDAIVSGLTARDQAALASDFHELASAPDLLAAMGRMLKKHLVDEPVWRTQLLLEIWAEAARNPAIAAMCGAIDHDVETNLSALIGAAQAASPALRGGDPAFVVRVMGTVVAGLFKRRATEPTFDGNAEVAMALGVFRAALTGALTPYPAGDAGP
jgi:AcrR family transcriptional regulator